MSESTALLLYHVATGVRVFFAILATFSGFVVWVSIDGMAGDLDNDAKMSLLNTCVRNVLISGALIGLSVAIPDRAWFLALARSCPGQLGEASKHIRSASEHVADVMFAIKGEIGKEAAHAQA